MQILCFLVVLPVLAFMAHASADNLLDDFKKGELNQRQWCPCQINMAKAPVTFSADQDEKGDHVAQITVDETSLGGNKCKVKPPEHECGKPIAILANGLVPAIEPNSREYASGQALWQS